MSNNTNMPVYFGRDATLNYLIKPMIETDNLTSGAVGTRRIAAYPGIKQGDPLASFQMPDSVFQVRPTTAAVDGGTVAPFGNPTASKQTWALTPHMMLSRVHGQLLTDDIGNTTSNIKNSGDTIEKAVLSELLARYSTPIQNDMFRHAHWSHTGFDPATTYDGTHAFAAPAIASLKANTGFLPLLKAAFTAGDFSNYKTTNGTGGIDVDAATLSAANANVLATRLLANASPKLRSFNQRKSIEYKPFLALSSDFYYALRDYVADTFKSTSQAYNLFADGTDSRRLELEFTYKGYAVYNYSAIFDDYWLKTNPDTQFNHMGVFMTPENLALGINLKSPLNVKNGNAGLIIQPRIEIEMAGAVDIGLYTQMDYLINDTSMFSSVGFEQLP